MGFIKKNTVQQFLRRNRLRTSKSLYLALDNLVSVELLKAGRRAGHNGRKTVGGEDL